MSTSNVFNGFIATPSVLITVSAALTNTSVLPTGNGVYRFDNATGVSQSYVVTAGGASNMTNGLFDGQRVTYINSGAAQNIVITAMPNMKTNGGASVTLTQFDVVEFVWLSTTATTGFWYQVAAVGTNA